MYRTNKIKNNIIFFLNGKIVQNSTFIFFNSISNAMFGFLFWFIASKSFKVDNIGVITSMISISSLISVLSIMQMSRGLQVALTTENFETPSTILYQSIFIMFINSIIASIIFVAISLILKLDLSHYLLNLEYFLLFYLIIFFTSLVELCSAFMFSLKNKYFVIYLFFLVGYFVKILVLIILLNSKINAIPTLLFSLLTMYLAWFALFILYSIKNLPMRTAKRLLFEFHKIKSILAFSFGTYVAYLFHTFPSFIAPTLALELLGPNFSAYFYIVWLINSLLFVIPSSVNTSLIINDKTTDYHFSRYLKIILFIWLLLIPIIFILYVFSPIVLSLFGKNYSNFSHNVLFILNLTTFPMTVTIITLGVIQKQKNVHLQLIICSTIIISWIIFILPMINFFGIFGIAITFFISYIISSIFSLVILIRITKKI